MVCLSKIWKTFLLNLEGIGREILEMLAIPYIYYLLLLL